MKRCPACGEIKPLSEYYARVPGIPSAGVQARCKPCHRLAQSCRVRGITVERYWQLWNEQKGVCAICLEPERFGRALSIDHDHQTGVVRALLCNNCNIALGHMQDDETRLYAAARYLERFHASATAG